MKKTIDENKKLNDKERFNIFDKWFNTTLASKSNDRVEGLDPKVQRSRDISTSIHEQRQKMRVKSPHARCK